MGRFREAVKAWFSRMFGHDPAPEDVPARDTEFTAEVVRITRVEPHPNADRLEIARFALVNSDGTVGDETLYPVVIQKGQYRPGDSAAYFSVDCIVPLEHPLFAFIGQYPEGRGKSHFRLRAKRLRGTYSQGLLTPSLGLPLGTQLADRLGVSYYRRPEPGQPTQANTNRKPRVQPIPVYTLDSLAKLPHLFDEGEPVHITEKIHGSNFRFGWIPKKFLGVQVGWKFVIGSHHAMKGDDTGTHYYGDDVWLQAAEDYELPERTRDFRGLVFYGELYGYTRSGRAIQDLTYGRAQHEGPGLAIFEVVEHSGQRRLSLWERRKLCDTLELDNVPLLAEGVAFSPDLLTLSNGPSTVLNAEKQIREGIVVEAALLRADERIPRKAKYVGSDYHTRTEEVPERRED